MPDHNLLLYVDAQFVSPYAMSAFVSLSEKALGFRINTVDLRVGEHQRDGFARTSMTRRVQDVRDRHAGALGRLSARGLAA